MSGGAAPAAQRRYGVARVFLSHTSRRHKNNPRGFCNMEEKRQLGMPEAWAWWDWE